MKYKVDPIVAGKCLIELLPENDTEKQLLKEKEEQDTFLFHYIVALEKYISKDATFIAVLDYSQYPQKVKVEYQITKGIG